MRGEVKESKHSDAMLVRSETKDCVGVMKIWKAATKTSRWKRAKAQCFLAW